MMTSPGPPRAPLVAARASFRPSVIFVLWEGRAPNLVNQYRRILTQYTNHIPGVFFVHMDGLGVNKIYTGGSSI
jgi:hypothetical protein